MSADVPCAPGAAKPPSRRPASAHRGRRQIVLGNLVLLPAALLLPGCGAPDDDLPPPPLGARRFDENGAWETPHDGFAEHLRSTLDGRYGRVAFTDYLLPRTLDWGAVTRHYDGPLAERGWRLDEALSGALRGGDLRVWAGGWRRAWRGALAVALLRRPDPDRLGLGHSFFVGATHA